MVTHYKSWLERAGTTTKVQRLEFLGFVKEETLDKPQIFLDRASNAYLCGLYKCKLPDGSIKHLKFRCEYDPSEGGNDVGWNYNLQKDAIKDDRPDEITCSREMCLLGKVGTDYESIELQEVAKKHYNVIMHLETILKLEEFAEIAEAIKLKLNYMLSPTRESSRCFFEYKKKHPDKVQLLNELIYG
jgi:hypothetical protein